MSAGTSTGLAGEAGRAEGAAPVAVGQGSGVRRRDLLRIGAAGLVGVTAATLLDACRQEASGSGPAAVTVPLRTGWRFGAYQEAALAPGFDDGAWPQVTVPHCVADLSWHNWDPASWERRWIYRRRLDLPQSLDGLRLFLDFDGVLVGTRPSVNGHTLPQHLGGYLPFSYELTGLTRAGANMLAVEVDSRWLYVPPEGARQGAISIDYLEPGGIYRDVRLRAVPEFFIADVWARPLDVLDAARRRVEVQCTLDAARAHGSAQLRVLLRDARGKLLHQERAGVGSGASGQKVVALTLGQLADIQGWSPESPTLYQLSAELWVGGRRVHQNSVRIGFRQASFEVDGFFLNGSRYKLFGLNRHQIFPWRGMAMPARAQRRDAEILRQQLNCNMVRCSHYPQSPHFLDACDEFGLMVWEETPGWGFVGDAAWQQLVVRDVHDMVVRDRNRPSVIIWGVRVNEAPNNPVLWGQTRAVADSLDGTRPTSGSMTQHSTVGWHQDVFAMDDYSNNGLQTDASQASLMPPLAGVPYLVTEAVGAIVAPHFYQRTVPQADQQHQAYLHAQVHSLAAEDDRYAGLIAWCGFDYDSLQGYEREHVKWPGVVDTFRVAKPGASFYLSQVSPASRVVIEPAFYWDFGSTSPVTTLGTQALVFSNCDRLEVYVGGQHSGTVRPATWLFAGASYPPFLLDLSGVDGGSLPELRLDGYVGTGLALSRRFAADPRGDQLLVRADDASIVADGVDATRVFFRAVDRYGAPRPYVQGSVRITRSGPAALIGEGTFDLGGNGGVGAVWVLGLAGQPGRIGVRVVHPTLGQGSAEIQSTAPPAGQLDV